jgi:DNA-binding transcriptional MerR regulator
MTRVLQIRGLLEAGLPTRMIKRILPCLNVPGILYCPEEATPEMLAALEEERDRMTQRIQFLARNRDAIASYLDVARTTGLPGRTTAREPQTTPRPTGAQPQLQIGAAVAGQPVPTRGGTAAR